MLEQIPAKTIVTKTKSADAWFGVDYHMNIYKGCCHGCIYCDSRSACYGIEDFDRVRVKKDALAIIRNELRRKVKKGVVGTGAMSDPYNPFEQELLLTRHALELVEAFGFGASIATKSTLITRDIDVLQGIKEHSPVICKITVTSADDDLAGKIEPGAPPPSARIQAAAKLSEAGLYTGILLMPVLPFLEDSENNIRAIVGLAKEAGASFIYPMFGLTLRENQRLWYYEQLNRLFPEKQLTEQYRRRYGNAYECRSPQAKRLSEVFIAECTRYGVVYQMKDIIAGYKKAYEITQITLDFR